jgi:SSS family solute:Na+ symporter
MNPALLVLSSSTLVHLSPVDLVIIVFYFALVLAIGLYLKEQANTGEDFFMAGREMTAWRATLISTVSWRLTGIGSARSPRCCSSRW